MFYKCSSLTSLNLSNFNSINIKDMDDMFIKMNKSCNLICNDDNIANEFKKLE